jgi:hypothetical protein
MYIKFINKVSIDWGGGSHWLMRGEEGNHANIINGQPLNVEKDFTQYC